MEINDSLVNKLASLARLRFTETEKEALKADLQKMISFVQKMNEVDTTDVEPLLHMSDHRNRWRADNVQSACTKEEALQSAARHNKDFFLVPTVIQK